MTAPRKGYVTDAEADLQFKATKSEQDYRQEQLSNLQALHADTEAAAEKLAAWHKVDKLFDYGGIWFLTSEQRRQIPNTLLQEFVLYRDAEMALRSKLPVNEKQVADTIATLSSDNVLYDRVDLTGRDSPVPTSDSPAKKEQSSRRWR